MSSFPQLPALDALTQRSLDEYIAHIISARDEIIRLRHMAHNASGEMKEHYKFVITDHIWSLTGYIGKFYHKAVAELGELELPQPGVLILQG